MMGSAGFSPSMQLGYALNCVQLNVVNKPFLNLETPCQVEKAKLQSYFAKVDLLGAILAICGGLMINSATGIDLYLV